MNNTTLVELIGVYQDTIAKMNTSDVYSKYHILDNSISENFKAASKFKHMIFLFVPPDNHGRNITNKEIQTAKFDLVSIFVVVILVSKYTYGVNYIHRLNSSWTYFLYLILSQIYYLTHISIK